MNTREEYTKSDVAQKEEQILNFWNEHKIFEQSLAKDSPQGTFVFYDGPPFATGLPHYGHLLPGTIKDIIPRYKTMKGYHVPRKWGWDCHGLPIENLIEKELDLPDKKAIEDYGIGKFNQAARDSVLRYEQDWKEYVPRSGRWIDMDNPYMSMDSDYMESVWSVFSQLHQKNLTKEGFNPMHLCPRCETTLANFEVNQGYKDVTDISVTAMFTILDGDHKDDYFLAWTTTPWTLPGNVALAVGEDTEYVKVNSEDRNYIVAKELVESVFEGKEYTLGDVTKGKDLVGTSYQPVFDYYQQKDLENSENGWKVYPADFVTTEDGTGIVHIAPAFGSDDMELGKKYDLPFIQHVAKNGAFNENFMETTDGNPVKGLAVKKNGDYTSVDIEIIKRLAQDGTLFSKKKLVHSYPHCWRCDTPLLNYATESWYVSVPEIRDDLLANNQKVDWVPENIGDGRFGNWLEGARDWALSRSRFWGTPLPVWTSDDKSEQKIIGSVNDMLDSVKSSGNTYTGVRHGQAQSNVDGTINADPSVNNGLTDEGKKQSQEVASQLKDKNIDLVFVSPFQRTQETASIIQQELGLSDDQIIIDDRIAERNPGSMWEGKSWHDAHQQEEADHDDGNFWTYKLADDAESISDIYHRVMNFLFDIESEYQDKNILIVSHGGVLKTIEFGLKYFGNPKKSKEFYYTHSLPGNAELLPFDFKPFPYSENYQLDLHRPYIDDVVLISDKGNELHRIEDVFDVWFDSGSMPYAQVHYPFEHKEDFVGKRFPAQFIAEGLDQTRGWFYVMSVLGTALFNQIPFEHVVVNGLVLAEDGKKMSKSLKNYPDMNVMLDSVGADALRLFLIASPLVRAEEHAFSEKGVREVLSKVMNRLRNTMTLYQTYKDDAEHDSSDASSEVLDKWIVWRLRELENEVSQNLESYELDKAARPIFDFVDDFSTWYIRRSRDRFKGEDQKDKAQALATTRYVFTELSKIMAPFVPFIAEELWQDLKNDDDTMDLSVHLSSWPDYNFDQQNKDYLETIDTMDKVRSLVSEGLQLRADAGIKVRQALATFTGPIDNIAKEYYPLITDELNVKELKNGDLGLDTELTPELYQEGVAREFLRSVQSFRKNIGLVPSDMINLTIQTNDEGKETIEQYRDEIMSTAGIANIHFSDEPQEFEVNLNDLPFSVSIQRT